MWKIILICLLLSNHWNPLNGNNSIYEKRIYSGKDVGSTKAKFMATIRNKEGEKFGIGHGLVCGGCLISIDPVKILSAAHCFYNTTTNKLSPIEIFTIVLGAEKLYNLGENALKFDIEMVYIKKGFQPETKHKEISDIAVATVVGKIEQNNPHIQPIKLADNEPAAGTKCTVMGWGDTTQKNKDLTVPEKLSDNLLQVEVTILSIKECESVWEVKLRRTICAGKSSGMPCPGDDGGPLICNNVLAGIIKGAILCGFPDLPTIYTSVPKSRVFIDEVPYPPFVAGTAPVHLLRKRFNQLIFGEFLLIFFMLTTLW